MLLQGLFVPLTCPFYRDGASYLRKLEHNMLRYSLGPAAGMVALAPGTESAALTDAEAADFLRAVGETAAKQKVLVAGVEAASVHAALQRIGVAADAGFDAALLVPPTDWARLVRGEDARELLVYYKAVADASPLPIVLWSAAAPPSFALPLELIAELAREENVIGLIDADLTAERLAAVQGATESYRREVTVTTVFEAITRRMLTPVLQPLEGSQAFVALESLSGGAATAVATVPAPAAPSLKTRTKTVGFQVLSAGPAHAMVPLLASAAAGAMPTLAAPAPQACFEAYAAWKDGDPALAAERAERLEEADQVIQSLGPAAVKYGCDLNGYYGGQPRLPRLPFTAEQRAEVDRAFANVKN